MSPNIPITPALFAHAFSETVRALWPVTWGMIIGLVLYVLGKVARRIGTTAMLPHYAETQGTVAWVGQISERHEGGTRNKSVARICFSDSAGHSQTTDVRICGCKKWRQRVGQTVPVWYLKANPKKAVTEENKSDISPFGTTPIILGKVLVLITLVTLLVFTAAFYSTIAQNG